MKTVIKIETEKEILEKTKSITHMARALHSYGVLSDPLLLIFEQSMAQIRASIIEEELIPDPNQPELL